MEVENCRSVLVDPQDADIEFRLDETEAAFAYVAAARVVIPALGVVPVWHHHTRHSDAGHDVQSIQPMRRLAYLVDLVDRDGSPAQRECRRGRERHGSPSVDDRRQSGSDVGLAPDVEGVTRGTWTRKDVPGLPDGCREELALDGRRIAPAQLGDSAGDGEAGAEEIDEPLAELRGVLLETKRGVQDDHLVGARRLDAVPMGCDQAGGELSRPQDDDPTLHEPTSRAKSRRRPATRCGCSA